MSTLFFIITVLFIIYSLTSIIYFLFKKNFEKAKKRLIWIFAWIGIYAILLVGISLQSKEYILSLNEDTCFDDWCVAVADISQEIVNENEIDYFVKLKVSSRARRVSQRPDHPYIYFVDNSGKHSEDIQAKLQFENKTGKQIPINSLIEPQSSFNTTMVFRIPKNSSDRHLVINEGSFPVQLMIGDRESFLYKDTIFQIK